MRRRALLGVAAASIASMAGRARAQAGVKRVAVIAKYLREPMTPEEKAEYLRGFEAHGVRPGHNLEISWHEIHFRGGGGEPARRALAAQALASRPDCIVADSEFVPLLLAANRTIPIVTVSGDPVREGLAASLQKPGGNVTGLHNGPYEVAIKRIQLLRAFVPDAKCVAWIAFGGQRAGYPPFEAAAHAAGLRVRQIIMEAADAPRFDALRKQLNALRADGCVAGHFSTAIGEAIEAVAEVARERKLALSYIGENERVKTEGLLFVYAARTRFFGRGYNERLAGIAARILRGERAGDIAFEGPLGYYLFLNARTASLLGLKIPPEVSVLADQVF